MATKEILYLTAGVIIGGIAGYFVTKKMLEADLQAQIDDVKEHYKLLRKEGEYSSPENVPTSYEDTLEGLGYSEEGFNLASEEPEDLEDVLENVEDEEDEEREERFSDEPYVISVKEFMDDKEDYDKVTVTYFEGDDTLCDEREQIIPDIERTVGTDSLTKFGHLSDDKNVVYVRNDVSETDFEVTLDKREYSEVVLGIREEKFIRKMRDDD